MDLTRPYKNSNLEAKRQKLLREQQAVARMTAEKKRADSPSKAAVAVRAQKHTMSKQAIACFDNLLAVVERECDLLDEPAIYVPAISALARWQMHWLQAPADWRVRSHNAGRCFASLARHLLAKYDVPSFLDGVWLDPTNTRFQEWFVHIGRGGNIRKARTLPVELTKMQAHEFVQAPNRYTAIEAMRWGQIRGIGGEERLVEAVNGTFLGRAFVSADREAFWATVMLWLVQNQTMDVRQVGPVLDYIKAQKFDDEGPVWVDDHFENRGPPQPAFTMKGRTVDGLLRQTQLWHGRLAKVKNRHASQWPPSGINGLQRQEGESRIFRVDELLTSAALSSEGRAMHHCVGSYAQSCVNRRCAIFSMQLNDRGFTERMLTLEVELTSRTVVQAKKKRNAPPTELDLRVLNIWATRENLTLGRWIRR